MGIEISPPIKDVYIVKADTGNTLTHTGDTSETNLKSYTIPGGIIGSNGSIRIRAVGVSRGNSNIKVYKLKLGGIQIADIGVDPDISDDYWYLEAACHNLGIENDQNWSYMWFSSRSMDSADSAVETAIDTSIDQILKITGQLGDSLDEVEIRDWTIEIRFAG